MSHLMLSLPTPLSPPPDSCCPVSRVSLSSVSLVASNFRVFLHWHVDCIRRLIDGSTSLHLHPFSSSLSWVQMFWDCRPGVCRGFRVPLYPGRCFFSSGCRTLQKWTSARFNVHKCPVAHAFTLPKRPWSVSILIFFCDFFFFENGGNRLCVHGLGFPSTYDFNILNTSNKHVAAPLVNPMLTAGPSTRTMMPHPILSSGRWCIKCWIPKYWHLYHLIYIAL